MAKPGNKLVIFDLDETLIHARTAQLDRPADINIDPLHIYVRPFASDLISRAAQRFTVAIWSAGSPRYVEVISEHLLAAKVEPLFVWDRERCSKKSSFFSFSEIFTKDLTMVEEFGFGLESVLIIEDDPVKIADFKDNAIIVRQYLGEAEDSELERLSGYFDAIDTVSDIRDLDKNLWCFEKGK